MWITLLRLRQLSGECRALTDVPRGVAMVLLMAVAAAVSGCNEYVKQSESFVKPYSQGQYEAAAAATFEVCGPVGTSSQPSGPREDSQPEQTASAPGVESRALPLCADIDDMTAMVKSAKRDAVLARVEQGIVLRYAGRIEESCIAFDHADQLMAKFGDAPSISLSREAIAALTNLSTLDYRGCGYDRIMANVYKALNFMELGQLEAARVELKRAYEAQKDAVAHRAEAIEKAAAAARASADDNAAADGKGQYDWERASADPGLVAARTQVLQEIEDMSPYAPFANPFAEYLRGVYFLAAAQDASDRESAILSFRRTAGMTKDNPYVLEDIECAERLAEGGASEPLTYVFLESGMAPRRGAVRIDVPIFVVGMAVGKNLGVDYVGASFPKLVPIPGGPEHLEIETSERACSTALLMDMDSVIAAEFKEELPLIITKTLMCTAAKAAAAYGLNAATRGNSWANIATRVATTVYQAAVNEADLRTWRTLPKRVCVARFPTPADRKLMVAAPGSAAVPVQLADAPVNIVYVKAPSNDAALAIRSFAIGSRVASTQ